MGSTPSGSIDLTSKIQGFPELSIIWLSHLEENMFKAELKEKTGAGVRSENLKTLFTLIADTKHQRLIAIRETPNPSEDIDYGLNQHLNLFLKNCVIEGHFFQ